MTDLGDLGGGASYGYGINTSGSVVGDSLTSLGADHAFLYQNGALYDLNSLLVNASGITLTSAYGINDSGQIVANSATDAYLLTPVTASVPEAGTLLTAALILGSMGRAFIRREGVSWRDRRTSCAPLALLRHQHGQAQDSTQRAA